MSDSVSASYTLEPRKIYAEIADDLIRWPARVQGGWVLARKASRYAAREGVNDYLEAFIRWFCEQHTQYHNQDVQKASEIFLSQYPDLIAWHRALLHHRQVSVRFSMGEPLIMSRPFNQWLIITAKHDPDSLIALQLAEQVKRKDIRTILADEASRWAMVARYGDPDLLQLWSAGVSDFHMHLNGCVPVPYVWQQLMVGTVRFANFRRYYRGIFSDKEIAQELEQMENARSIWLGEGEYEHLERERGESPSFFRQNEGKEIPCPLRQVLRPERQMLTGAWYQAISLRDQSNRRKEWMELLGEIDQYLAAKRRFLETHQQSYFDRKPGLPYFQEQYFRASRPVKPKSWERERSLRLQNIEYAHRLDMLADTKLRRMELRIAPMATFREYVDFLKQWQTLENNLKITERNLQIHFAVHFQRQRSKRDVAAKKNGAYEGAPQTYLRRRLDQDAAGLHLFRNRLPALARKIARIDVCGWERDAPANVFSFHVKLLRGDREAHRQLAEPHMATIVEYQRWWDLCQSDRAWPLESLPELGLTLHAGEDFYHPLDGLCQIDGVIEGMNMRAGDSLGHGLALGFDLERYRTGRGQATHMPRGLQFDCLVWLHETLLNAKKNGAGAMRAMELWIERECRALYGEKAQPIDVLHQITLRQHGPLAGPQSTCQDPVEQLWQAMLYDPTIRKNREQDVAIHSIILDGLGAEIEIARQHVLQKVIDRGIVIEANPSSNIRVGGLAGEAELPLATMVSEGQQHLRTTINTDNPGVFGIRIENEYAIAWQALEERTGLNRPAVLERLEKIRRCGMELPIPTNKDLRIDWGE